MRLKDSNARNVNTCQFKVFVRVDTKFSLSFLFSHWMRLFEEASGSTDAFQNHYFDFFFSTTQSNVIGPKLCEMYSRDEVK